MSDWDFLHEMHAQGYSADEIADAAGSGAAPWEWEHIDRELTCQELREEFPFGSLKQVEIFCDLVDCAAEYFELTGRYMQIWGELGELYAEIKHGLVRHVAHTAGSDGMINDRLVEVKTISPEKGSDRVLVKSQGDFEQLLIVRIDGEFRFSSKLLERSALNGFAGKFLSGRFEAGKGN